MRPDSLKYVHDVKQAADLLAQFTAERPFEDYEADAMLRSAVERQFEVIGEALARLARLDQPAAAHITDYHRIIAFRNILIHGYAQIDNRLVWDIVESKLPVLRAEVGALLDNES